MRGPLAKARELVLTSVSACACVRWRVSRQALEKNNKELQLKVANSGAGEMSQELEQAARAAFIEKLTEVLAMRRGGKFDANIFDEYNEALVQLGDADLADMYQARAVSGTQLHSAPSLSWYLCLFLYLLCETPPALPVVYAHLYGRGGRRDAGKARDRD
jgi:hypothetical protein